jgi:hypothetical protein
MKPPSVVTLSRRVAELGDASGEADADAPGDGMPAGGGEVVAPVDGDEPLQAARTTARTTTGIASRKVITGLRMARGSAALPRQTSTVPPRFPGRIGGTDRTRKARRLHRS